MNDLDRATAFAPILDRLGRLLPRLASDHPGEVGATAAAIGRTLSAAGLDWHDLAARVTALSAWDALAAAMIAPESEPAPAKPADAPVAKKPKREPPPWPTWAKLSHFGRLAMLDAVVAEAAFTEAEIETMTAFRDAYYRHQVAPGGKVIRLFNAACRNLWDGGWRPAEAA